jgi:hypothetical protein
MMRFSIFATLTLTGGILRQFSHAQPIFVPFTNTPAYQDMHQNFPEYIDVDNFHKLQAQIKDNEKLLTSYRIEDDPLLQRLLIEESDRKIEAKQKARYSNAFLLRKHAIVACNFGGFSWKTLPTEAGFRIFTYQFDLPHTLSMDGYEQLLRQKVREKMNFNPDESKALQVNHGGSHQDRAKMMADLKRKNDLKAQENKFAKLSLLALEMLCAEKWSYQEALDFDKKIDDILQEISNSAAYKIFPNDNADVLSTFRKIANLWVLEGIEGQMLSDIANHFCTKEFYLGLKNNLYSFEDVYYYYPIFSKIEHIQAMLSGEKSLKQLAQERSTASQALVEVSASSDHDQNLMFGTLHVPKSRDFQVFVQNEIADDESSMSLRP